MSEEAVSSEWLLMSRTRLKIGLDGGSCYVGHLQRKLPLTVDLEPLTRPIFLVRSRRVTQKIGQHVIMLHLSCKLNQLSNNLQICDSSDDALAAPSDLLRAASDRRRS